MILLPRCKRTGGAIKAIVDCVNSKIPGYKHIRIVEVLTEAPEKTTTRKIKRFGANLT